MLWTKKYSYIDIFIFQSRDFEDDLEMSLNLTEEIGELTEKMVGTVKSELARSRRKDFGSSYWWTEGRKYYWTGCTESSGEINRMTVQHSSFQ